MAAKKKATKKRYPRRGLTDSQESDQRKYSRHVNRVLCQYLTIQCWIRGHDGALISNWWLRRLYVVNSLRAQRLSWLQEDCTPWFTYKRERSTKWLVLGRDLDYSDYTGVRLTRPKARSSENYWHEPDEELTLDKMQAYLAQIAFGTKVPNPRHGR